MSGLAGPPEPPEADPVSAEPRVGGPGARADDATGGAETGFPRRPAGQSSTSPGEPAPAPPRFTAGTAAQAALGLGLAAALLWWGLPWLTGTSWGQIAEVVGRVDAPTFLGLVALMLLGLWCYTYTLTGSLPGLSHGRALTVNLAGSGVSNLLPGGGAIGTALTYAMLRSWRFTPAAIGSSIVVTTVWNLGVRVLLPVVAALVLLTGGGHLPGPIAAGAVAGGAGGTVVAAVLVALVASRRAAAGLGRVLDALVTRLRRARHGEPRAPHAAQNTALRMRATVLTLVRRRWPGLTFGVVGFMGVHFVLFLACARAVGATASWQELFAAYAVGRLLTAVAVTPGGVGVAEAGAAAVMLALGAPGDVTAATVALFAVFSFFLEIPFGALAGLAWALTRPR